MEMIKAFYEKAKMAMNKCTITVILMRSEIEKFLQGMPEILTVFHFIRVSDTVCFLDTESV